LKITHQCFNEEMPITVPEHEALVGSAGVVVRHGSSTASQWQQQEIPFSLLFSASTTERFNKLMGSDIDFDQVEMGVRHRFDVGIGAR
jgi:hypothetical protein